MLVRVWFGCELDGGLKEWKGCWRSIRSRWCLVTVYRLFSLVAYYSLVWYYSYKQLTYRNIGGG